MSLNIVSALTQTGPNGVNGVPGTTGTPAARNGGAGGNGTAGTAALLEVAGETFTGDAGADRINLSRTASGGNGGVGAQGGNAAPAQSTSVNSSGPGFSRVDTTWDTAGDGGRGGTGGNGGTGRVAFDTLTFDLGGGASQNIVLLTGTAIGGRGGNGGGSGAGGNSGSSSTITHTTTSGSTSFSSTTNTVGSAAGLSPDGRAGRDGRDGTVDFTALAVTGDNLRLSLSGTASGGGAGSGGFGQAGRSGSVGANGGDGGDAGSGGSGTATVAGLDLAVTGGLSLYISLSGRGGAGASGGGAGAAGWGRVASGESLNGVGSFLSTTTYASSGDGGDGGDGGTGTAQVIDSTIRGSVATDVVEIVLRGTGGGGGNGGAGAPGVADSSTSSGTGYVQTFVTNGTPAGQAGAAGTAGAGVAAILRTSIELGGGNDTLTLRLTAEGPGARTVRLAGNEFGGGAGQDRLVVGAQAVTDKAMVFDVAGQQLKLAGGPWNGMTGFESFAGGAGNDRFLDGAGSQSYQGNLGADRFEFRGGQAGADTITAFAAADAIRLSGFGAGLDSFAEVLAATTDTPQGALIQTGLGSSILLAGIAEASLTADNFLF